MMFKTIFNKEVLENIAGRRFFLVLVLCLIIIPLGVYVSSKDYESRLHNYQEAVRLYEDNTKQIQDVLYKEGGKGFRPPSPLSFLSFGLEVIMPNVAETQSKALTAPVDLRLSNNQSLDNLYEFFHGPLDLVFIVSVVMTFLAIVFTYGSVSGEKEQGTLKQILCNSVPRPQFILAKIGANFLALIIPFLIALLLSLILFQGQGFLFAGPTNSLPHMGLALLFSLLIIGAFFNLGLLVSTLTRQAVSSIVILLLCWVFLFGILPRLSVILSQLIYPVKSQQLIAFEKNQIRLDNQRECEAQVNKLIELFPDVKGYNQEFEGKQQAIREEFRAKLTDSWQKIDREMEKKRSTQMSIAANIARLSPVSCFIRPLAEISQTGWTQYEDFNQDVLRFEQQLDDQVYGKNKWTRFKGGISQYFTGDMTAPAPKFQQRRISLEAVIKNVFPDLILLVLYNLLFFAAAFVAFLRYDVR